MPILPSDERPFATSVCDAEVLAFNPTNLQIECQIPWPTNRDLAQLTAHQKQKKRTALARLLDEYEMLVRSGRNRHKYRSVKLLDHTSEWHSEGRAAHAVTLEIDLGEL